MIILNMSPLTFLFFFLQQFLENEEVAAAQNVRQSLGMRSWKSEQQQQTTALLTTRPSKTIEKEKLPAILHRKVQSCHIKVNI